MPLSLVADIHGPDALSDSNVPVDPRDYPQSFLAQGDSWFSLSHVPSYNQLFGLRFKCTSLIINCARPGATLSNIVDWRKDYQFVSWLGPGSIHRWSGILLSSGGNDLINATEHLVRPFPAGATIAADDVGQLIDTDNFNLYESYLRHNYADIIALRDAPDSPNKDVPIFTHTYDYATPRDAMATFLGFPAFGPWLYPCMIDRNIPTDLWIPLSKELQNRNANILLSLNLPNLHVIDTRGTLTPAQLGSTGEDGDWNNEIHPSMEGYDRLAPKWNERIASVLQNS